MKKFMIIGGLGLASITILGWFAVHELTHPSPNHPSVRSACTQNLRAIQAAKEVWAEDRHTQTNDIPSLLDLFGPAGLRYPPQCPSGGHYILGSVNETPRCSVQGHTLP